MNEPRREQRTPLSQLLASAQPVGDAIRFAVPDDWLQGRAIYGGLTAALCLAGTRERFGDALPELRCAQIAFIGPAGGEVDVSARIARQGRSTAFVTADLHHGDDLVARANLCFARARESGLAYVDRPAPRVPAPEHCASFLLGSDGESRGPRFTQHFNSGHAAGVLPLSGSDQADFSVWLQHKDPASRDSLVGLVALADALPPAALPLCSQAAPLSTMTWAFDLLTAQPRTTDGWWLCRSRAEAARDGYSTQMMDIWNRDGEPVMCGRQNVAMFC